MWWVAQHLLRNLIFQQNQSKECFKLTLMKNSMIKLTSLLMDSRYNIWLKEKICTNLTLFTSTELRMMWPLSWERSLLIGWLRSWRNSHLNERHFTMLWTMLIDICRIKRIYGSKIFNWSALHLCLWHLKWKKFYLPKYRTLLNQLMMDTLRSK